jgi:hypothetical protein
MPAGCNAADPSIDGQPTITLPVEAGGKYVSVLVTLDNSRGRAQASTIASTVVTATPVKSADPVISGDDISATGKALSVTDGTWVTAPSNTSKTFAYSWYACPAANSAIANCAYIGDTAGRSIAISDAMVDKFVVAKVTVSVAVNKPGAGTAFAYSNASSRIRKSAAFSATPLVTGYMNAGETISVSTGNPTGVPAPQLAYAWYTCTSPVAASVTAVPAGCTIDASATSSTYVIPNSSAGSYVLAMVKASSDSDLATVYRSSVSTVAVSSGAVLGATVPAVTGTAVLGSPALSVSNGTWTWKPSTLTPIYSYRWFACASTTTFTGGATRPDGLCNQIASQTASTLTLTTAELGFKIVAEVTVTIPTNTAAPSKSVYNTAVTGLVMSKPVAGSTPPSIYYTALTAGSVVQARTGTWTGSPTPALTYSWYKCPAATTQPTNKLPPATCGSPILSNANLTITSDLKGYKLLLYVLAANDAGTATNVSTLVPIP